jgi:hypothetical protein
MKQSKERLTISIIGAGGKMGTRTSENLARHPYTLHLCETAQAAVERIRSRGQQVSPMETAVPDSDVVILAVPDRVIGPVSADVVPRMRQGAMCMLLDPAAAYLGEVRLREDCTFVVAHPTHPPLFAEQESLEALKDHFGGTLAYQDVVIALMQGPEAHYAIAETLCRRMFGKIRQCHRITVEQMALLEPAAAEVLAGSALSALRAATDEVVRRGVPEAAARAFMLGHIRIILAVLFDQTGFPVSDAAKIAFEIGNEYLVRPDWKRVFEPEAVRRTIERMVRPR